MPSSVAVNITEHFIVLQVLDAGFDAPTFSGHIDHGKEASQLHSLLVDLLDKVDNKVPFWTLAQNRIVSVVSTELHCVPQKNDTDVTHYRFNPHQPISVIFGRDVAERVCY